MRCKNYVGVSCVDGTCPVALSEKYEEYGCPVIWECEDCWLYRGCQDCALDGTEYCNLAEREKYSQME